VSTTRAASRSSTTPGPDSRTRLPAVFIIHAGGRVVPPVIAAPRRTAVALVVVAGDHRAHRFVLHTPRPYVTTVVPGRSAHALLSGIPNGTYAADVDGVTRARLIVGATPGP
jgi:hypothetical protein